MQATGFLLDIPRVEVLINSSRLSSKLTVDVKLLPIKAVLQAPTGDACAIVPYVEGLSPSCMVSCDGIYTTSNMELVIQLSALV